MRICIVTPAAAASRKGNRTTALRWARLLRSLGHRVVLREPGAEEACDVLVAMHARRSAGAAERFRREQPGAPLVVALTGTDLYEDIDDPAARRSLELADRLVLLQSLGIRELPAEHQPKARVIWQSARRPPHTAPPDPDTFGVLVLAHLRPVKDPLLAAVASAQLPPSSRVHVRHLGAPLDDALVEEARAQTATNPRYTWAGPASRLRALRELGQARLLVLTSRSEGGANVVSEAIACGTPVVSTRIPGSVGMLGEDYPGYFPAGDAAALAELLERVETDPGLASELADRCGALGPLVEPAREREAWASLLDEVGVTAPPPAASPPPTREAGRG